MPTPYVLEAPVRSRVMHLEQIAPQLWWWTAPHPEWKPNADKDGKGWGELVSSYALVEDDALVLFDPLVPTEGEDELWKALDGDVEHHGPPAILITVDWHARSAQQILDRYEGASLWVHKPAARRFVKRAQVTNTFGDGDELPAGVESIPVGQVEEVAYWLPRHESVVLGDTVLAHDGRAHLCPPSWLRKRERFPDVEASVRAIAARKPSRLLLTHGGPTDPSSLEV
jgi:glyoxylase-like metal-dependent hydrolase (beta-lactamase superfamily II)